MIQFVPEKPLIIEGSKNSLKGMAGELLAKLVTKKVNREGNGIKLDVHLPAEHRFLNSPASRHRLQTYLEDACDCPVIVSIAS